jgi:hypothetical protein
MHKNESLNRIIMNLNFLLASSYKLEDNECRKISEVLSLFCLACGFSYAVRDVAYYKSAALSYKPGFFSGRHLPPVKIRKIYFKNKASPPPVFQNLRV